MRLRRSPRVRDLDSLARTLALDLVGEAETYGVELDETPESLAELDTLVSTDRVVPSDGVGYYLGMVIVGNVPGAGWRPPHRLGPPLVHVGGIEINIIRKGLDRFKGGPDLVTIYRRVEELARTGG